MPMQHSQPTDMLFPEWRYVHPKRYALLFSWQALHSSAPLTMLNSWKTGDFCISSNSAITKRTQISSALQRSPTIHVGTVLPLRRQNDDPHRSGACFSSDSRMRRHRCTHWVYPESHHISKLCGNVPRSSTIRNNMVHLLWHDMRRR